jgi:hypothetical protein
MVARSAAVWKMGDKQKPRAVAVLCQHVLERPNIERLVCNVRFQPPVLFVELAQRAHLRHFQPAVLAAPV